MGAQSVATLPFNTVSTVASLTGDSTAKINAPSPPGTLQILNNGSTTYAGLLNSVTLDLQGGSANTLRVTNTGTQTDVKFQALTGGNLIMDGAKWTGTGSRANISGGGYISAGNTTTASVYRLDINASTLKVNALSSTSTSLITSDVFYSTGGYMVDVPAGLVAGTYPILRVLNVTGAGGTLLPTTGVNDSGLTATYAWSATTPKTLLMTLA
jgi:FlaG/FlaF family flagellin (archaellin)